MPVTSTNIPIRIFVDDITGILALYDEIRIWRSTGDQFGPWSLIAGSAGVASILGDSRNDPFLLAGKTLELRLHGVTVVPVTFSSSPDPYPAAVAAVDIDTALGVLGTASVVSGQILIQTALTGTEASIEIAGGTGYSYLGFQSYDYGIGTDDAVVLVPGQQDYDYIDHNGDTDYWYRTQFRNSVSGSVSEFSVPFPANKIQQLPSTELITGTCRLVDLKGFALQNQEIHVYNLFEPSQRSGYTIFGMDEYLKTDTRGEAEISLVRGSLVEVAWVGTSVRRRIRVPTTGASFDLLDASLAEDNFGIHIPAIRLSERRSP